jgi:hypothetical protein
VPAAVQVLDLTGPEDSTLSAPAMCDVISAAAAREVTYTEAPLPGDPAYEGLWQFLRAGGFDCSTKTCEEIMGFPPRSFASCLADQAVHLRGDEPPIE